MRICIVSPGLLDRNRFVQPWRYLLQGASALNLTGHRVFFLSDRSPDLTKEREIAGFSVQRIDTLHEWPLLRNEHLERAVNGMNADVILWRLGVTSFLHMRSIRNISNPVIGIFTSPIYNLSQLFRLGLYKLVRNQTLSRIQVLGSFVPSIAIRRAINLSPIQKLIVECETTQKKLLQAGVPADHLQVIKPYINPIWYQGRPHDLNRIGLREKYGFLPEDFIIGYFGATAPLRGLPTLLHAIKKTLPKKPHIRLFILSRVLHEDNKLDNVTIMRIIKKSDLEQYVHILPGMLSEERLIQCLNICDVIALPFEMIISDVPITILETLALGIPLITTSTACIPELVPEGAGIRVRPGDVDELADAILEVVSNSQLRDRLSIMGREQALSWTSIDASHKAWNDLVTAYASKP